MTFTLNLEKKPCDRNNCNSNTLDVSNSKKGLCPKMGNSPLIMCVLLYLIAKDTTTSYFMELNVFSVDFCY